MVEKKIEPLPTGPTRLPMQNPVTPSAPKEGTTKELRPGDSTSNGAGKGAPPQKYWSPGNAD